MVAGISLDEDLLSGREELSVHDLAGRSVYAVKALEEMGFTNVAHLAGGFKDWKAAGEPIEDAARDSRWVRKE